MIARILSKTLSASNPLEYNEKKRKENVAEIIASHSLPMGRPDLYEKIFSIIENNMRLNGNAKYKGFHMTISPGMNETLTDNQAYILTKRLLREQGLEEQPWVIYKHNDTGHTHYHIISTRVDDKGKIIPGYFDRVKMQNTLKENEKKFGYVTGKDKNYTSDYQRTTKYNPHKGYTEHQIRTLVKEAMTYSFTNEQEFLDILRNLNIIAKKKKFKDEYIFWGTDNKGNIRTPALENIDEGEIRNSIPKLCKLAFRKYNTIACEQVQNIVESAFYLTDSRKAFREYLRGYNIDVLFGKRRKDMGFEEIQYIDTKNHAIYKHSEFQCGLTLTKMSSAIRNGNWGSIGNDGFDRAVEYSNTRYGRGV